MIYKSNCSAFITAVMKYLNFHSSGSKLESVTCKFTQIYMQIALRHCSFSKNFTISAKQRYWKMDPDGCFWWKLYSGNFPEWLLLKRYIYLRNYKLHIFQISYCDVMLKRNEFLWIFVRQRFPQNKI